MRSLFCILFISAAIQLPAQNVGIGNTDPAHKLDLTGRMRIRGGADLFNSAGVYLGGAGAESLVIKSLMGMASDTAVGFYGFGGGGWGLIMDIRNGNTGIGEGTPLNKSGFTVNNKAGAVHALFGSNTSGIAIESDFPGIGFNTYYNGARRAIVNGYGGYIGVNPGGGGMQFSISSTGGTGGNPITLSTALYIKPGGNIGIGTTEPGGQLQLSNSVQSRKIVLYEQFNNDHQFYGFGINSSTLRYQVAGTSDNHIFYSGAQSDVSAELFRIQGNGNVGVGVSDPVYRLDIGARMRIRSSPGNTAGLWLNNAANNASPAFIGMQSDNQVGFFGSGAGWGITMNTQNGSLNINGSQGQPGQVLMSNGSSSNATWAWPGSFLTTDLSGLSIFNDLTGSGPHDFTNATFTINLPTQARVIIYYYTNTQKYPCLAGNCSSKWKLSVYNNGSIIDAYYIDGNSYAGPSSDNKVTSTNSGPTFLTLSPGSYTFTFSGTNLFNEPSVVFRASYMIINM